MYCRSECGWWISQSLRRQSEPEPIPAFSICSGHALTASNGTSSDTCTAAVTVDDCQAPEITCPAPTVSECTDNYQAMVDPGLAEATDLCSNLSVNVPGASSYPMGAIDVGYTATDTYGNAASCGTTVMVVDTTAPEIQCNAQNLIPSDTPISFTASAQDACGVVTGVDITDFECWAINGAGAKIDKKFSCVVQLDGDTLTVVNSGGVGDNIEWTVSSSDDAGNISTKTCSVTVEHPKTRR